MRTIVLLVAVVLCVGALAGCTVPGRLPSDPNLAQELKGSMQGEEVDSVTVSEKVEYGLFRASREISISVTK